MTLTEDQRIAIIKLAVENSKKIAPSKSVEDFVEEIKSEQFFEENGLFEVHDYDIAEELELGGHQPNAESIDEEDEGLGVSEEMQGIYHD
jgi:hypothetical protein